MANAGFLLGIGALIIWLMSSGKLNNIINVIRGGSTVSTPAQKSGPLVGGEGLLFG